MTSEERENMIMNVYEVTEYKSTRLGFLKFCGIVFALFMALLLILGLPGAFVITLILGTAQENANTGWAMQIHTKWILGILCSIANCKVRVFYD